MAKAGDILGEHDPRLWRRRFAQVKKAYAALDLSWLVPRGVAEMSPRKGHPYLTVLADLIAQRVVFATAGMDHTTFRRLAEEILQHHGHPKAIPAGAIDRSAADQKGGRDAWPNAQGGFDPFHVSALVSTAVDEVRRAEAREGAAPTRAALKGSLYLLRKNPENLSEAEAARRDELDLKHLARGQA
jgi:transposase